MRSVSVLFICALIGGPAFGQDQGHGSTGAHHRPYAGLEQREIKALSKEQFEDLRAGRGMSLAQAAELNGYPGPRHVLELAQALGLTPDQEALTRVFVEEVQRTASELGVRVIEQERVLDALFAAGTAAPASLASAVSEAALVHGRLRALHLEYHLKMRDALTPRQVARYNELRGYTVKGAQ